MPFPLVFSSMLWHLLSVLPLIIVLQHERDMDITEEMILAIAESETKAVGGTVTTPQA